LTCAPLLSAVSLPDALPIYLIAQVDAETVERAPALDRHAEFRHVGEGAGVVRRGEQRFGKIATDFLCVDVECARDLDIRDVIPADHRVHQSWNDLVGIGIAIVRQPLNERGGTVPGADDADANAS